MSYLKNICRQRRDRLLAIIRSFGLTEKTVFAILSIALAWSGLTLLWKAESFLTVEVPAYGGSLTEGLVGSPRFINPLLEMSDSDRDLTYLVYSGLMRAQADGSLKPDLAESYTISSDGLSYDFKLRADAVFQDGRPVTTDDIEYTVAMAQDISLRSPKRNNWLGVEVEKISQTEITFKLKQPYSPFLENTTLGILPKHIWQSATAEEFPFSSYNIDPIGSGPYQIEKIVRSRSGLPESYALKAFDDYALGEPYITDLTFNFYANEQDLSAAYASGAIESTNSLSPQSLSAIKLRSDSTAKEISLPRVFGVFFNQNQNKVFLNKEVRSALNMTVDKDRIVSEVLNGYGQTIDGPLPNGVLSELKNEGATAAYNKDQAIASAKEVLTKAGWVYNETDQVWEKKVSKKEVQKLAFSISTSNVPDLKKTAEILKEDWGLLGAQVEIQSFDPTDLNQSVISQRKYDALLFGQVVGRSLDLFASWHSSQRNTGNNVAMYVNSKADKLLEDARQISDQAERLKKYALFENEIANDLPAIFLYSPDSAYILPAKIQGFQSGLVNNRAERFENISGWYIETDRIWKFLAK